MPELIITADDCGLSKGINQASLELHQRGYLSAASVMTNFPAHRHALALFAGAPTLDLGVHLNLTEGNPVLRYAPRHSHLLRRDHRFRSKFSLYLRGLFFNTGAIHWIRNELDAQVRRCHDAGLRSRHITTHHHFHTLPILREIVHELAAVHQVDWVRGHAFRATVTPQQFRPRKQRHSSRYAFALPEYMTGVKQWIKRPPAEFAAAIAALDGRVEIVVHPGLAKDPSFPAGVEYGPPPRFEEMSYLIEAVDRLRDLGVELCASRLQAD